MYEPNPENQNCLSGVVCPECGNTDHFVVEVKQLVGLTDDGTDAYDDAVTNIACGQGPEWDEDSHTVCVACEHRGKMGDFMPEVVE